MIFLTCGLTLIHLVEIAVWGLFYFLRRCLPDLESALYFSGVTYTSAGYGDVVLPIPWRMFAPIETLTGVLMCGLSSGLFFAFALRWIGNWMKERTASEAQSEAVSDERGALDFTAGVRSPPDAAVRRSIRSSF